MKEDRDSFLEIFQDPLLTIVALILLNTTWVVIPDRIDYEDIKPSMKTDGKHSIQKDVKSIEGKVDLLKSEIMRKQHELEWLKKKINELHALSTGSSEDIAQVKQKIEELEKEIEKRKDELKHLEEALKMAKSELANIKGLEDVEEIYTKISEFEKDIESKYSELRQLENQISIASQSKGKLKEQADEQKRLTAQLQTELRTKLEEIERLKAEISRLNAGGGFRPTIKSDKDSFEIELENNRLFPVNLDDIDSLKKHYDCTYYKSDKILKLKRKPSVKGEGINEIESPDSIYSDILNKAHKEERPISFDLSGDSFEIFYKAREIAHKKGIGVSWWVHNKEKGVLIFNLGSGGGVRPPIQPP